MVSVKFLLGSLSFDVSEITTFGIIEISIEITTDPDKSFLALISVEA